MSETLSLAAVKARFSELVDRVEREQDRVVVTRNGKPAAVLISPDDLERLEETLAVMSDRSLTKQIRDGQAAIFAEDMGILEAQQRNLSEQPSRHLMRLNIDMGGFEARRILERLVAEEQNDLLKT